jgi:hypothetical protein
MRSGEESPVIPGFELIKAVYSERRGTRGRFPGGIAVFVKQGWVEFISVMKSDEHVIWLRAKVGGQVIIVGFVYNQPRDSPYTSISLYEDLQDDIISHISVSEKVFILGDFNARTGRLDDRASTGPPVPFSSGPGLPS